MHVATGRDDRSSRRAPSCRAATSHRHAIRIGCEQRFVASQREKSHRRRDELRFMADREIQFACANRPHYRMSCDERRNFNLAPTPSQHTSSLRVRCREFSHLLCFFLIVSFLSSCLREAAQVAAPRCVSLVQSILCNRHDGRQIPCHLSPARRKVSQRRRSSLTVVISTDRAGNHVTMKAYFVSGSSLSHSSRSLKRARSL